MEENLKIIFNNMEPSDALKKYVTEKIFKHKNQHLLERMTLAEVHLTENTHSKGVDKDFQLDVNVDVPNSRVHVEETGDDMYALIDAATDKLFRRLKRYNDKRHQWDGATPWRVLEAEEAINSLTEEIEVDEEDYSDYTPPITVHEVADDLTPRNEAEAIELMELGGYDQYLFKHMNGKICMVYRNRAGGYGFVEPADEL